MSRKTTNAESEKTMDCSGSAFISSETRISSARWNAAKVRVKGSGTGSSVKDWRICDRDILA